MGKIRQTLEDLEKVGVDVEAYEQIVDDLRELHDLENMKAFLEEENGRLKSDADSLTGELEGLNIAAASVTLETEGLENRICRCLKNIDDLKREAADKSAELSGLHLRIKAALEDVEASFRLQEALSVKLSDMLHEREILTKRLNDMQAGLRIISNEKKSKLPTLKGYHSVLKQIHNAFKETQNRMDVSIMLRNK